MSAALLANVIFNTQTAMRSIMDDEYARLSADLWWSDVARVIDGDSSKEIVNWLLSTAQIRDNGIDGGNFYSSELVQLTSEYEPRHAGDRLELKLDQWKDSQGKMAVDLATKWAADIGYLSAYWPQKMAAQLLKDGETAVGYDAKAFFATDHPLNPRKVGVGTYSNLLAHADYTVTASKTTDQNLLALQKVMAHIRGIRMPNGVDPRKLRPSMLIAGPSIAPLLVEATQAKFIARGVGGAATGGGSQDVEALHSALGFGRVIMADEFVGNEYDASSYFVVCEQASSSQLGGLVFVNREPFKTNYYSEVDVPQLMRTNHTEWICDGRNVMGPGHPYLIFKIRAAS
jgi:hypothetical protein